MNQEILSHWHPNMTINLVVDQTNWVPGQVPPPLNECKLFVLVHNNIDFFIKFSNHLKNNLLLFFQLSTFRLEVVSTNQWFTSMTFGTCNEIISQ